MSRQVMLAFNQNQSGAGAGAGGGGGAGDAAAAVAGAGAGAATVITTVKFKYYCRHARAPNGVELIAVEVEELEYMQKLGMLRRRLDGI